MVFLRYRIENENILINLKFKMATIRQKSKIGNLPGAHHTRRANQNTASISMLNFLLAIR